jgi:hypothetical protein
MEANGGFPRALRKGGLLLLGLPLPTTLSEQLLSHGPINSGTNSMDVIGLLRQGAEMLTLLLYKWQKSFL